MGWRTLQSDLEDKAIAWIKWLYWYSGIKAIASRFQKVEPNRSDYVRPPSGVLWLLGLHFAAYSYLLNEHNVSVAEALRTTPSSSFIIRQPEDPLHEKCLFAGYAVNLPVVVSRPRFGELSLIGQVVHPSELLWVPDSQAWEEFDATAFQVAGLIRCSRGKGKFDPACVLEKHLETCGIATPPVWLERYLSDDHKRHIEESRQRYKEYLDKSVDGEN